MNITDEMVMRFLNWKLPEDFHPDCGIAFKPPANPNHAWPVGTNLLTAIQAKAMLEHVLSALPSGPTPRTEAVWEAATSDRWDKNGGVDWLTPANKMHAFCKELELENQRLKEVEHAAWHALESCEETADSLIVPLDLGLVLSRLLPEDHPDSEMANAEAALSSKEPTQIIDPPGAAVEIFRQKHGRLPNRKSDQLSLGDRLELAAQACRAAHLLSCESTCREAATALSARGLPSETGSKSLSSSARR